MLLDIDNAVGLEHKMMKRSSSSPIVWTHRVSAPQPLTNQVRQRKVSFLSVIFKLLSVTEEFICGHFVSVLIFLCTRVAIGEVLL
jgi:hypothetical protein